MKLIIETIIVILSAAAFFLAFEETAFMVLIWLVIAVLLFVVAPAMN